MNARLWTILVAGLLAGCSSDERSLQGPGSETSGFSARVVDGQGRAVAGVAVRAVALDRSWRENAKLGQEPILGKGVSDSEGLVRFTVPSRTGRVGIEIADSLRAGRVEVEAKSGAANLLTLESGASVRIAARVPGETVGAVLIAGTGYRGRRGTSGAWTFSGMASGRYTAVAVTDSGIALLGRFELRPGASLDTAFVADSTSVLLEDFSMQPVHNRYGELLGAGWWYTTIDSAYGGKSTVAPSDPASALVPCIDGNCLEMRFRIDPSSPANFALVGLDLDRSYDADGSNVHLADLSKTTAVRFDALGSGSLVVQIHFGSGATAATCAAKVDLDSTWKTREVLLGGLSCDGPMPVDRSKAVGITFLAQSDLDLRMGRLVLVGAGPRSVFPDLKLGGSP